MAVRHLLLAVAALGLPASASATRFVYSGTIETYVVPTDGIYRIMARGAGGGFSIARFSPTGRWLGSAGGNGGAAEGLFQLSAGTTFSLVIGGAGRAMSFAGAGGGGGSFVFIGATPYVIGGGGGGGGLGYDAIGQSVSGVGGTGIGGAASDAYGGAAGAGWFGDGQYPGFGDPETVGRSSPSFVGGYDPFAVTRSGGFGGGGAGTLAWTDSSPGYGGGGGGGYTGGNGGFEIAGGSAGTSYVAPFSLDSRFSAGRSGDGLIIISKVPEPESWALLVVGFGVVGGTLRARRRQPA